MLTLMFTCLWVTSLMAQEDRDDSGRREHVRAHYSKYEYRIPMRDGVRLFTSVYVPNDSSKEYPFLLLRTPYSVSPYGLDRYKDQLGPSEEFEKEGFIFVFQDVRGRFMSEGEYVNMRPHIENKEENQVDESTDTYDTIDWLLKNIVGHNGKVGQWGISYPGFYTSAGAIDSHPALAAISPQAPIADWFWDDMHHHGAFVLSLTFNFFSSFGVARPDPTTQWPQRFEHGTPDGYQFFLDLGPLRNVNREHFNGEIQFWNEIVAHPNYDEFWQARNILPHLKNIRSAVMIVGGWFDTEDLYGPLKTYASIERNNPNTQNVIVVGPWSHGQWSRGDGQRLGSADWGFATSKHFRERIQLPFFMHHLKGSAKPHLSEATMFETGANRWREFDTWPPADRQEKTLYLHAEGRLSLQPPTTGESEYDEYVSDPQKPVPHTMEISSGWTSDHMTEDQRFASWRPDVLVYRSDPLEEDLTLAGPVVADLWASTSGRDSDWVVKLIDEYPGELPGVSRKEQERREIDVYPGGRQMLVRADVMRGRFRESYQHPRPFEPDEVARIQFELQDVLHTFKRGHRLMVHVQSTWFPFIDRNPQSWVPNIFQAAEEDYVKTTNRVYRDQRRPSGIRVGVLGGTHLP
jgi:putative CocE/NonD family hydrolase